ncbi:hypothetical protein [Streptomyces sp. NPDC052042]|uniref:hypothetical protein n=1 Tax=Streptomyces sp. NPDC052042 TaxID=3365683 RepID=UPI0037CE97F0
MSTTPRTGTDPLVELVAHVTGEHYEEIVDKADSIGGSTAAVVEQLLHLAPAAPATAENIPLSRVWQRHGQVHHVEYHGSGYWLQFDHLQRFYTLYRQAAEDPEHRADDSHPTDMTEG